MTDWTLCGCEVTQDDLDGVVTRCSRDGISEHLLIPFGLAVRVTTPATEIKAAS